MAKSKYESHVKPHLDRIREWKKTGATDANICKVLGISETSFYDYQKKHSEFSEALKKGTVEFTMDLRGELAKLAKKHTLKTTKTYAKTDSDGKVYQYKEITEKEVDADLASIHLLLKNLDDDWKDNPANYELKKQELELKKALAQANTFDLEL